jgi:Tol biopolymer transport system component
LTLAASSGRVIQKIELKKPVYNFALSKDRKQLVTVSVDTETGGNLYLLNLQTHALTKLTNGHLYFKAKELNKNETEVYDDPQFSPDGRSLAFAIHTDNPGDGNDAEDDAGPIAVIDLQTRKVRVLKSTENIEGQGLCFANTPMWSPDGKWILFNCENGAFITDAHGTSLRELRFGAKKDNMAYAISWVGNGCVLSVPDTEEQSDKKESNVMLFDLHTSELRSLPALFAASKRPFKELIEASEPVFIRQMDSGISIETNGKTWTLFTDQHLWKRPPAHVLGGWQPTSIPTECK